MDLTQKLATFSPQIQSLPRSALSSQERPWLRNLITVSISSAGMKLSHLTHCWDTMTPINERGFGSGPQRLQGCRVHEDGIRARCSTAGVGAVLIGDRNINTLQTSGNTKQAAQSEVLRSALKYNSHHSGTLQSKTQTVPLTYTLFKVALCKVL